MVRWLIKFCGPVIVAAGLGLLAGSWLNQNISLIAGIVVIVVGIALVAIDRQPSTPRAADRGADASRRPPNL